MRSASSSSVTASAARFSRIWARGPGPGDEQDVGHIDLDVQYLPDITVGCPTCHGARFNDATLAVRIDGLTVADVLGLSVDDALKRFADHEPSTGLHPLDVATLAGVFDRLLDAGATIIVIDHDLDLLAAADHLIDMGPGGGPDGGHIVAAVKPQDVARDPAA